MVVAETVLDLGCGKKKRPGTIGVDFSDRHDADVIHNLDRFHIHLKLRVFLNLYG